MWRQNPSIGPQKLFLDTKYVKFDLKSIILLIQSDL